MKYIDTIKHTGITYLMTNSIHSHIIMGSSINKWQYYELDWFSSGQGLLEVPCECDIEPLGFISHGVI